jgi:hypothetical protein
VEPEKKRGGGVPPSRKCTLDWERFNTIPSEQ